MVRKGYATLAKIRAVYGKRLTNDDYNELLRRQDVTEAAEYLKRNTHYSNTLAQIDTNTVHRELLEVLIRRDRFEEYLRLCKFERLFDDGGFYSYIIKESEVTEILSLIRHINANSGDDYISSMPSYLNQYSSFDYIGLAKVRSYGELLEFLKHTPYCDVLKNYISEDSRHPKYTDIEVGLRTYFFKWLLDAVHRNVKGKSAEELETQIKIQIDFINIINSYRLKNYFNISADEIEKDMLPFYGRLSKAQQHDLFMSADGEDFLRKVGKTVYGRQMADKNMDVSDLELGVRRMRYKYAKSAMCQTTEASVCLYSFMYLSFIEVSNVISIIEGIRYQADPKKIESLLVI